MTQAIAPLPHPLVRCLQEVADAVDGVAGSDPIYLPTAAKGEVLAGLTRQIARLEGLRLSVLAAAGDVADETGARSPGAWLAHRERLHPGDGRRLQRLAEALDARWPGVRDALTAGDMSLPQAEVVVAALDDLPGDLDPDLRVRAEAHLIGEAEHFDPQRLRVLGRRILEVVAPDVADDHERRALERAEARARARMRITTRALGNGLSRATVDLPTASMDLWLTQLHAFASPRRDHLTESGGLVEGEVRIDPDTGERIRYPQLLAQAFCTMLERMPAEALPRHGGVAATLMVTMSLDQLRAGVGVAELSTGHTISPGEFRRLACNADLIPAVLGGDSEILDLGRAHRLFKPAQRKAMAVRDRTCRTDGCDIPAAWTEAHHLTPWSRGGKTDLRDGVLLCSWHHHRAHDPRYDLRRLPNGDLRFRRRN
jgi:hypothetical protein